MQQMKSAQLGANQDLFGVLAGSIVRRVEFQQFVDSYRTPPRANRGGFHFVKHGSRPGLGAHRLMLILIAKASVKPLDEMRFAEAKPTRRKLSHLRAIAMINEPPTRDMLA